MRGDAGAVFVAGRVLDLEQAAVHDLECGSGIGEFEEHHEVDVAVLGLVGDVALAQNQVFFRRIGQIHLPAVAFDGGAQVDCLGIRRFPSPPAATCRGRQRKGKAQEQCREKPRNGAHGIRYPFSPVVTMPRT